MVDRARFDVILGGNVTARAKKDSASLRELETSLRRVGNATRTGTFGGRGIGESIFGGRSELGRSAGMVRGLTEGVRGVGRQLNSTRGGAGGLLGTFGRFGVAAAGLAAVASTAADVAGAMGRITYAAGGAYLSIASFRQDSITGLTTVLGNQEAAGRAFRRALVVANETPLDPQDVIGMFSSFAVGGFTEGQLEPLARAAADIQAARGTTARDSLVRVLQQIRGLGRVQRGDITMQGISAGLNAGDIFDSIARQLGYTGANARRRAEQAVTKGRVNDAIGVQAFMDAVQRRYDNGGALGSFARNSSSTLTGSLSNLRGSIFTLLASIDLSRTPGVQAFTRAVLAVTGALDMGSRSGRQLRGIIVGLANAVGTGLFEGITPESIAGGFEYLVPIARGVVGIFRTVIPIGRAFIGGVLPGLRAGLWPVMAAIRSFDGQPGSGVRMLTVAFRGLGRGVGFVVGLAGSLVAFGAAVVGTLSAPAVFIASIPGMIAGVYDDVTAWGANAADGIINGFVIGLETGAERIVGAVSSTFTGAVDAARGVLDWHSPSGVFRDAGQSVAEGFTLGIGGGSATARAAVMELVAPRGLGGPSSGAPGNGGVIYVNVDARGAGGDPRAIARMAVEELVLRLEGYALAGAPAEETR